MAVGTSAAIIAWQGIQVLGIASTGTAIGGLSGIAASNAGWAAFGGGSLATGGGGILLGQLVLPGIGVLVAVGVSAVSTHSKANKVNELCDQLDSTNDQNNATLVTVSKEAQKLDQAERTFLAADASLKSEICDAGRKLRRFGWITAFYRYVRFKVTGVYYTADEQRYVQQLKRAVDGFMTTFGVA